MNFISDDDMQFHARVVSTVVASRQAEAQLRTLQQEIADANALARAWTLHLTEKYSLSPEDVVSEAGEIVRPGQAN